MVLAFIPIVIHLINRHRAKLRRFAAIDFLLLSDKRVARRLKLKQLLVLALRVALLAFLAFALSKPYIQPDALAAPSDTMAEPGAVAIIIDDSLSMAATTAEDGEEDLLTRAVAKAEALIAAGGARTSFAVIAAGEPVRSLTNGLTYDKAAARRALQRVQRQPTTDNLEGALTEAGRVLSQATEPRRKLIVLTDRAKHSWSRLSSSWAWVPMTTVDVIDLGAGEVFDNLAITSVRVTRTDVAKAPKVHFSVTVHNFGATAKTPTVEVSLGPHAVADPVTIKPGHKAVVELSVRAPSGVGKGVVSLRGVPDALVEDNTWYFTVDQSQAINVLIV